MKITFDGREYNVVDTLHALHGIHACGLGSLHCAFAKSPDRCTAVRVVHECHSATTPVIFMRDGPLINHITKRMLK